MRAVFVKIFDSGADKSGPLVRKIKNGMVLTADPPLEVCDRSLDTLSYRMSGLARPIANGLPSMLPWKGEICGLFSRGVQYHSLSSIKCTKKKKAALEPNVPSASAQEKNPDQAMTHVTCGCGNRERARTSRS